MADWRFTGQEFEILWSAYGRDRLPYPLQYRPAEMDFADLKREREAAVETLLTRYSTELERALDLLLDPEVRIESKGLGGHDVAFRFHGAVRGRAGATLVQLPGSDQDTGADVLASFCTAKEVAKRAVTSLPKRSAGTHPPIEVRREQVGADRTRPVRADYEVSVIDQLDRIFQRERIALGEVMVCPGPAIDARPSYGRGFWWMDYADGRYYVKTGDPIVARPMNASAMANEIYRLATHTQRFYLEDKEHDEYLRARR
ncbi:ESX secretion-associated protein EspG [Nocardia callitridis]|uniref:ESX secretion-associated protein EspG n=1 Tax=Nocardia callitridis TaxID=648753 RepID=A0ABP9JX16_9NOCA